MPCRFAREALPLESTPVDNLFILEYMPAASGTQLSVYLYGLMMCRYPAFSDMPIGDALGLSNEEVLQAFAYWQREGLLRILSADPLEVEYVSPSQRSSQPVIVPGKYHQLIQAAQQLFAPRALRAAELRRLYDWIEVYAFEESVVLELISHCLHHKGPRVSMSYMDAVARAWADAGVHTAEDAKAHAAAHEEMTGGAAMILKRWNKSRRPTQDELDLYEKWGVAGIKVDFMNRDDQLMMNFYERVLEETAKRQMVVNFHGTCKSTGSGRTYPNLLTQEGLIEFEFSGVSEWDNPDHRNILPFVRNVAGPMDYIPGTFNNVTKKDFRKVADFPQGMGTRAHFIAMAITTTSPM
ncbi:MAG: hypothetical protein EOM66_11130, partial [Clostridia bacterium]|nr:hypothetical protein [Clostridia bacterium]